MKYIVLSLFLFTSLPAFCAEKLEIDASHSAVIFHWSHLGFSNPVARLEKIDGVLLLDKTDLTKSSVSVKFALDGLRTGNDYLDKRLRTAEFLDAAKYPDITFKSTKIEKEGADALKISGDLTVHGVTKTVVLDAKINKIGENAISKTTTAGFDAEAVLRRSDFGVSKYVPAVTDELFVHITLEAHPEE